MSKPNFKKKLVISCGYFQTSRSDFGQLKCMYRKLIHYINHIDDSTSTSLIRTNLVQGDCVVECSLIQDPVSNTRLLRAFNTPKVFASLWASLLTASCLINLDLVTRNTINFTKNRTVSRTFLVLLNIEFIILFYVCSFIWGQ